MSSILQQQGDRRAEQFRRDLAAVINRHSIDAALGIPDYALADFLDKQLEHFQQYNGLRENKMAMKPAHDGRKEGDNGPR